MDDRGNTSNASRIRGRAPGQSFSSTKNGGGSHSNEDDGCQIQAAHHPALGWIAFLVPLALVGLRRARWRRR